MSRYFQKQKTDITSEIGLLCGKNAILATRTLNYIPLAPIQAARARHRGKNGLQMPTRSEKRLMLLFARTRTA